MDGQYKFGYYRLRFSPLDKQEGWQLNFLARIILTYYTPVNCLKNIKGGIAGTHNGIREGEDCRFVI